MVTASSMLRRFIVCPACGTRLSVSAALPAGTQICCGACVELFRAPGPAVMNEACDRVFRPIGGPDDAGATPALSLRPMLQSDSVPDSDDVPDTRTEEHAR